MGNKRTQKGNYMRGQLTHRFDGQLRKLLTGEWKGKATPIPRTNSNAPRMEVQFRLEVKAGKTITGKCEIRPEDESAPIIQSIYGELKGANSFFLTSAGAESPIYLTMVCSLDSPRIFTAKGIVVRNGHSAMDIRLRKIA